MFSHRLSSMILGAGLCLGLSACATTPSAQMTPPTPPAPVETVQDAPKVLAPETPEAQEEAFLIADQLFWIGAEGNLGTDITAKCKTRDVMFAALDLRQEVGNFDGRPWLLADILVAVDLNANGDVASWLVSGPKPLIKSYLESLRAKKDKGDFYDFSSQEVPMITSASLEGDEG